MQQERFIKIVVEDSLLPDGTTPERIAQNGIRAIKEAYSHVSGFVEVSLAEPEQDEQPPEKLPVEAVRE